MKPTGQTKPNSESYSTKGDEKALWVIAWCLFLFIIVWATSCATIEKFLHKQKESTDSTTRTRTDSLAYHQKVVKEGYGLSVHFDTGCTNRIVFNPSTGLIEASGNVQGVSLSGNKEAKQVDSVRLQGESETILQKEKVEIKKHTEIKPKWWVKWLYIAIGALSMLAWHHRKYLIKLILPVFNPLTQLITPKK